MKLFSNTTRVVTAIAPLVTVHNQCASLRILDQLQVQKQSDLMQENKDPQDIYLHDCFPCRVHGVFIIENYGLVLKD